MILYNVTTKVDHSIALAWLQWIKKEHLPEVTATGCFLHARILKLTEVDETDGLTYAVQYEAESKALYNRYIEKYADELRRKAIEKWGNKTISFRTVMQVIE
ncbi:MAG: DUF4286 family protein [Chitinophagaceae bacterium]|nr:DUF4286 family protein [Chitinophagaceae bacterium]